MKAYAKRKKKMTGFKLIDGNKFDSDYPKGYNLHTDFCDSNLVTNANVFLQDITEAKMR